MTKKEKIEILQGMKTTIIEWQDVPGLCKAYEIVTGDYPEELMLTGILGLKKPSRPFSGCRWWQQYLKEPRIRAINKAIKELQK